MSAQRSRRRLLRALADLRMLAGDPVTAVLDAAPGNGAPIGGIKVATDNGWFAARPSGTEDVLQPYAESFVGAAHLQRIRQEARDALAEVA